MTYTWSPNVCTERIIFWPGCAVLHNEYTKVKDWFSDVWRIDIQPIGSVVTSQETPYEDFPHRIDFFFGISDKDHDTFIQFQHFNTRFCSNYRMYRWDNMGYNNQTHIYPKEFLLDYPTETFT
jgi:hypothetical protein